MITIFGIISGLLLISILNIIFKIQEISTRLEYLNNRYHTLIEEMEYYRRAMKNECE